MFNAIEAVRVFSGDFAQTRDFFEQTIGFPIGFESEGVCVYDLPGSRLILEELDLSDPESAGMVGRFTGISFAVENINKTYKELKDKGVIFDGKPVREDWGGSLAHFMDPDNNVYTLVEYPKQN